MRVLVCATEYYPAGSGIANVAYNVVQELEGMGVECTVCSPTGPDIELGNSALIKRYGILGILHYWHQVSQNFISNDYDIAWLHNPLFLGGNPFNKYLVTMHTTLNGVSNRKVGNSLFFRFYKVLSSKIESYCLNRFDSSTNYTCVSPTVCNELKGLGIPSNRISCIPNGVNITRFSPMNNENTLRARFGLPEDDIILLSIGRLTHQKQPFTMIEVFSHLEKNLKNVTLCIAGKGELLEATKNLAQRMGLRKVIFLGYIDDRDLPKFYACADYYIMTSKYEGLPLTLLEAMSSGLACIVSDIPNLAIVRDAECGIVINFEDVYTASEQILNYVINEHSDHSRKAREYVLNNHNWHLISKRYLKEFLEVKSFDEFT